MIDAIRKTFLAGLGATVASAETIEKTLNELVEKGRITAEEARSVAQRIIDEGRKEFDDSRRTVNLTFEDMLRRANVARESQVAKLEERVNLLESRILAMQGTAGAAVEPIVNEGPTETPQPPPHRNEA